MGSAERLNAFVCSHDRFAEALRVTTSPLRRTAMPVLHGSGRGLRFEAGSSTMMRLVTDVEGAVERAFLSLLSAGDAAYDIGANVGWYSLLAARAVGPGGHVVAIEPSIENVVRLRRNMRRNGFENVTAVQAAAGDQDGWARFRCAGLGGFLDDAASELVPVVTLDRWIEMTGSVAPTVVKIDVEGSEASVIEGMAQTLANYGPKLIIELHGTNEDVADVLDRHGYSHQPLDAPGSTRSAPWWTHILAVPR